MIANIALILYTLTTLAIFKAVPVTLTLAGIAGFILSVGMAVDANILIFRKNKRRVEQQQGFVPLPLKTASAEHLHQSFDSNVNGMIACGVLVLCGTSIVKGFAVTLAIGAGCLDVHYDHGNAIDVALDTKASRHVRT